MTALQIGDFAPDFMLDTDNGGNITLSELRGKKVVVYFYPKDDTPGCTSQAIAFRDNSRQLTAKSAVVVGISKDSCQRHDKFKAKYDLNFPLACDEQGSVCAAYDTWIEKNMYGKKYMGISRDTFLIDEHGKIKTIWRKVKVANHIEDVLAALDG